MATQELVEEDWAENWKKYYEPARSTHDLTIVPSWTDYEASVGEKIIKLDPGMAFGTGTHRQLSESFAPRTGASW